MTYTLTPSDRAQLATLATRDEDGQHFTTRYDGQWLATMEEAGAIRITRPVHDRTGIAYAQEHWTVEVLADLDDDTTEEEVGELVLVRSDLGDGGWSLHPAGSTDEDIAEGRAPVLASGTATMVDGVWDGPTEADYAAASDEGGPMADIVAALLAHDEGAYGSDPVAVAREWHAAGFYADAVRRWLNAGICRVEHAQALEEAGIRA